jgi:uroporphyrinogen decarboxylase
MMRQAGRHLPEYREVRAKARDFLDFCYSPSLAAEATLQPVRRYGMDGAILFADILLILDAMGRNVRFIEGEGPRVDPATKASELSQVPIEKILARLAPVGETVERVRASLDNSTTLIGFAGSPWTVGVYAIEGRGGTDKADSRKFGYRHPEELDGMLEQLVEASAHYLLMQANAGADALMLFESWAEDWRNAFDRWVIAHRQLVSRVPTGRYHTILGFPGAGALVLGQTHGRPRSRARHAIGWASSLPGMPVQGNLDPGVSWRPDLEARVHAIVNGLRSAHIFNLGHGVTPETPIPHVERVLAARDERHVCRNIHTHRGRAVQPRWS